jgi:hypothetical protein
MKKETLQQNLPAIIAIALPVLLVLIIALLTMLPNLGPKPQYDFLFVKQPTRSHYEASACVVYSHYYDTEEGKLVKKPYTVSVFDKKEVAEPCYGYSQIKQEEVPELYIYRTLHGTVYPISFEQASMLETKGETVSPDGYTVTKRMINRGILELFGGSNDGIFISKKNQHIKINIDDPNLSSYYGDEFNFITWTNQLLSPPGQR